MSSTTVTIPPAQDARVLTAFGNHLNLGRDATPQEYHQALVQFTKDVVTAQETIAAKAAALAGVVIPTPVTPT
jgi:hypothetical protein